MNNMYDILAKMRTLTESREVVAEKISPPIKTDPSERGKYKGKDISDLKKMKSAHLKHTAAQREAGKPVSQADKEKTAELNFALRAKQAHGGKWGKIKEQGAPEGVEDLNEQVGNNEALLQALKSIRRPDVATMVKAASKDPQAQAEVARFDDAMDKFYDSYERDPMVLRALNDARSRMGTPGYDAKNMSQSNHGLHYHLETLLDPRMAGVGDTNKMDRDQLQAHMQSPAGLFKKARYDAYNKLTPAKASWQATISASKNQPEQGVAEAEIPRHLQGAKKSDIPAFQRREKLTMRDLEHERDRNISDPDTIKKINRGEPRGGKPMGEADMEEANEFTGNRLAAIKAGEPTFKVGKKTYRVTGDTSDEKAMEEALDMSLLKAMQKGAKPTPKDPESERNIHKKYGYRTDRDDEGGADDDYDEWGNFKGKKKAHVVPGEKRGRGRPKGAGKRIGAKGPSGKSKLMTREGDEDFHDYGEYDREGEMAKEQLSTAKEAAAELQSILDSDENLPEWVQNKITKAVDYLDTARDYMDAKDGDEEPIAEEPVSKNQAIAARIARGVQKGTAKAKPGSASAEMAKMAPKELKKFAKGDTSGLPKKVSKKKEESVEETTVAGSVAPGAGPAADPGAPKEKKSKGGMQFGKGVYEAQVYEGYNNKLKSMLAESMNISANMGTDEQGSAHKSLTVTATDDDAEALAQLLSLAGMSNSYQSVCPQCGQSPCACDHEEIGEELANSAHNDDYSDTDTMVNTLSGGLNSRKTSGQTTLPIVNRDPARQGVSGAVEEIREQQESRLWEIYARYGK